MLRIVCSADLKPILEGAGWTAARVLRVLKHGVVDFRKDAATRSWDVLVDRDANDLPAAAVTFLRNNAAVFYVAEWDLQNGAPYNATTNPDGYRIWKGADPGYHKFAGWPV